MKKVLWFLWILIFLFAGIIIFVSLVLYKPDIFLFQPSFSQNVSALAMMLTALMTLVLAAATFHTIKNSNEREERRIREELARENRDRKESLLNENIEWACEIQNSSLDIQISPTKTKIDIDTEILLRYGIPFSKNDYIIEIVKNLFPGLEDTVIQLRDTFVGFLFLKGKDFGMENLESAFKGPKYSKIIETIKQELNNPERVVKQLLREYSSRLAYHTNELLKKSADSKSRLV